MKLETYLTTHGLTDAAFARLIGVQRAAVGKLRKGLNPPSPATAQAIAKATNGLVTPNDFFDLPQPSSPRRDGVR